MGVWMGSGWWIDGCGYIKIEIELVGEEDSFLVNSR